MTEKNTLLIVPDSMQIVALKQSKVHNENRFHPVGAVGKIKAAPRDATHSYLIEFLDGSTGSLKRAEFSIRKQFETETAFNAVEDGILHDFIIYRCIVGSRRNFNRRRTVILKSGIFKTDKRFGKIDGSFKTAGKADR